MRSPVTVTTAMVSVEFLLYALCLCVPRWLVQPEGTSEGLFAICKTYEGFSSCIMFPAWTGTYSLSWIFLSGSSALAFITLFTIRPALNRGRRAIAALLLNIASAILCASALITFLVSIEYHVPQMLGYLGWSFYICCATLFYALVVSVILGLEEGPVQIIPTNMGPREGQQMTTPYSIPNCIIDRIPS